MDKFYTYFMMIVALLLSAQTIAQEDSKLPYDEIYAYGMDANVRPIFSLIDGNSRELSAKDEAFIEAFEKRFAGEIDSGDYETTDNPQIDELLGYFRDYWRTSLLDPSNNYMMNLGRNVMPFLMKNYPKFKSPAQRDSLGNHLADYIRSTGFYTTEQVNPNGKLVDLLVWKSQTDTTYQVKLSKSESINVKVVMLEDFVTLGWVEYATLGRHHPGGWTTEEALYCVKKSYDVDSETFKVSYLAHEARHFLDKQKFMDLSDKDLEYRSKLTELGLAKKTTHDLIQFFINNANPKSENGHQVANYYVIKDLSQALFKKEYQADIAKWKKVSSKKINKATSILLAQHTTALENMGVKPKAPFRNR